ncbi:MAG: cytochrome c3 family protein [Phycisphaerales bacterium]|nr:cytochrome c3 family protein [Phycisphaerales bacterium]MCB9864123.1 cytochrome c3 family protein [Phycisphaerales bacterium]
MLGVGRRYSRVVLPLTILSSVFAPIWAAAVHAESPAVGEVVSSFEIDGAGSLKMPTDVAVDSEGRVYVADGSNDRVVVFGPDGALIESIRAIGGEALSRPVGVAVDAEGRLYVADTGHRRALVRDSAGGLDRPILPVTARDGHEADITGVAVSPDGSFVWLVDNDNHRLIRVDVETGGQSIVGELGESIGKLHYPYLVSLATDGSAFVTDVLNGRGQIFNADGRPAGAFSTYGVELGQLYRPKGVVVDAADDIWVSDSVMGVVQVFRGTGGFIDALRDASGEVMRFESPMGLAMHEGHLYVAELGANRVRRVRVTRGEGRASIRGQRMRNELTGKQARRCTVCHMEWIEPIASGEATPIMDVPAVIEESPFASRANVCLSCHDSSVVDSRHRVWDEHGHQTGISPPKGMVVPDYLPLIEGKVSCRTCHSAHTGGDFTGDLRSSVFLRVNNNASQLCMTCHADYTRGPRLGTHPTGGMPWPVPEALIQAGAKVGSNPREITCQVCHTPHGSSYDHLLVMGVESNQLCTSCHDQMRPGMFREGGASEHPLRPPVNAAQKAAITEMGTRIGTNETLICLSCHKLHHGEGERFMLARPLVDSQMCIACHEEKQPLFTTAHDLRKTAPNERNRLGMTPETGGPCSSCHMFHRYARGPETHPLDPRGMCITCHQDGACAGDFAIGGLNHPDVHCTTCHDPHEARFDEFLRKPAGSLCSDCHSDKATVFGGAHDLNLGSDDWPDASIATGDACLACHRPHGDKDAGLWRVARCGDVSTADASCNACHSQNSWGSGGAMAAVHPQFIGSDVTIGNLPVDHVAGTPQMRMGCQTCHSPHSGDSRGLLRVVSETNGATSVCTECHSNMRGICSTGHGDVSLAHSGLDPVACGPCHTVHAEASKLGPRLSMTPPVQAGIAAADQLCASCHRDGGMAPRPAIASHPDVPMFAMLQGGQEMQLPLFNSAGEIDSQGRISCRTCHTPHGQPVDAASIAKMSTEERRAMRTLLRPFVPPNVCTTCHGVDALRRFLYFHDAERRGGALSVSSAAGS